VCEGLLTNEPRYWSELYAEYQRLYYGAQFGLCQYCGYGDFMFYVQAIEAAGSIDPDEVMKVIDDPDWTCE